MKISNDAFGKVLFIGAEAKTDFDTGEVVTNDDGHTKWKLQLGTSHAGQISVTYTAEEVPFNFGDEVALSNVVIGSWVTDKGKHGVFVSAEVS